MQTRWPDGKMVGHQTMFDDVWSLNIFRLYWLETYFFVSVFLIVSVFSLWRAGFVGSVQLISIQANRCIFWDCSDSCSRCDKGMTLLLCVPSPLSSSLCWLLDFRPLQTLLVRDQFFLPSDVEYSVPSLVACYCFLEKRSFHRDRQEAVSLQGETFWLGNNRWQD